MPKDHKDDENEMLEVLDAFVHPAEKPKKSDSSGWSVAGKFIMDVLTPGPGIAVIVVTSPFWFPFMLIQKAVSAAIKDSKENKEIAALPDQPVEQPVRETRSPSPATPAMPDPHEFAKKFNVSAPAAVVTESKSVAPPRSRPSAEVMETINARAKNIENLQEIRQVQQKQKRSLPDKPITAAEKAAENKAANKVKGKSLLEAMLEMPDKPSGSGALMNTNQRKMQSFINKINSAEPTSPTRTTSSNRIKQ